MIRNTVLLLSLSLLLHAEEPLSPTEPSDLEDQIVLGETITTPPMTMTSFTPVAGSPPEIKAMKNPVLAGMLSGLVPGLGHYYLGEPRIGSQILGGTAAGVLGGYFIQNDHVLSDTSFRTAMAVSWYGIYAAYRDAKLYNGNPSPHMPRDDLKNLTAASFQWSVIKKPEVWGGLLGSLAAGVALGHFAFSDSDDEPIARVKATRYVEPLQALPIAIAEECLFRGYLQPVFSDIMPPWGAITLSSVLFGAAHIPNAKEFSHDTRRRYYTFALPFITGMGAYMGWVAHKNHSLKECTALHMWYDFTLMCMEVVANTAIIGSKEVNFSYQFNF